MPFILLGHRRDVAEDTELGMGVHAGRDETSLLLYLRPDLVDMTKAVACVPVALAAPTMDPAAIEAGALAALARFERRDPVRLLGVRAEFAESG